MLGITPPLVRIDLSPVGGGRYRDGVTEPGEVVRGTIASNDRPKRAKASVGDLTLIVRVPGHPAAVQAFTDNERTAAQRHADDVGGSVEPLL